MPQIFPKSMNAIAKIMVVGLPLLFASAGIGGAVFYRSSYATGRFEVVEQPVPFSHLHHVGQLGIDCRYCHNTVEVSSFAGLPATKVCMNCHQQMWVGADLLAPVRESYKTDMPLEWNKVHNVPHYAYFNHSAHVNKGVGCTSCHGQINEMPLVYQQNTLLMEWCLKCHREPEKNLRPKEEIYNMRYTPEMLLGADGKISNDTETGKRLNESRPDGPSLTEKYHLNDKLDQAHLGKALKELYNVRDEITLTSCSMCHR